MNGDGYLKTATIDNSAYTTDSVDNIYAYGTTEDKVFLPSYQDYINESYGFDALPEDGFDGNTYSPTRFCLTTDYSRVRGAFYSKSDETLYNGIYWTRSPYSDGYDCVLSISTDGALGFEAVKKE